MSPPPSITNLPPEILVKILTPLEQRDRLALIRSHRHVELAIARNLRWFIPLFVPLEHRNLAFAMVHAPRRGRREHVRQFRTRVKSFLDEYDADSFRDKLPEPFVRPDGSARGNPHPRALARFRDLLDVLGGVDHLLRDYVGIVSRNELIQRRFDPHVPPPPSVLNFPPLTVNAHAGLGVGFCMPQDQYTCICEGYQTRVLGSFLRLELFRRLFYQKPFQPLFSSGDATPLQMAPMEGCLLPADARAHGFTTRWDYDRRARLWQGDNFTRVHEAWEDCDRRAKAHSAQYSRHGQRRYFGQLFRSLYDLRHRLDSIESDTKTTVAAFRVLWMQYALWVDAERTSFHSDVAPKSVIKFPVAVIRPRSSDISTTLFMSMYRLEDERMRRDAAQLLKAGADHDFAQHNMALVLPDAGKEKWPDMFRFLTFLVSLGIPFFSRCVSMDDKQRRQMLQSVFLYLGRLPAHRIPLFALGELDHQHPDHVAEFPLSDARSPFQLHPFCSLPDTDFVAESRLSAHLSWLGNRSSWTFLDGVAVSKGSREEISAKYATDVIENREELPFEVSDGQWEQMRKPRCHAMPIPSRASDCSPDDLLKGNPSWDLQFQRAMSQFGAMQKMMDVAGSGQKNKSQNLSALLNDSE
ncbi:hypothetical protein CSOJ01_07242 [Colletotrichum sojae]|uniref:F-box domain-containing protein n=1 Tax=Colletotrichum sojae TaxID=2175907 RepID=A0A8H6MUM4_9PEZI|nr:hypothetical protein CSOJ01_07242 [Colletotrichum sojae]